MKMDIERFITCGPGGRKAETGQPEPPTDLGMGPIDLLQEALKMLQDPYHMTTFACIHIIIVIPATFVVLLTQWFMYEVIYKLVLQPPAPPAPWPDMWLVVLVYLALSLGGLALAVNVQAAIFFTAGSMYSGKNVSFKQVIQALPGLWKGLFLTDVWGHAFYLALGLALFVLYNVFTTFASMLILPLPVLFVLTSLIASLVFFYISTTLQLACGVTVFEGIAALDAFARALALAKNQWCNALGLLLINDLPGLILGAAFTASMLSTLDPASKMLVGGFVIVSASVFQTLSSMSYALFYFSTKSCHNENISFLRITPQSQFEAGYQSIGGGSDIC